MFTETEKILADFFVRNKIKYEYEPLMKFGSKTYFPDFLVNGSIILERCGFVSRDYFCTLQDKLIAYRRNNKKIMLIFPRRFKNALFKNVKIPSSVICLIEDKSLSELTDYIIEFMGLSSSLV